MDEGTDSDDSASSDEPSVRRAPSFVPAKPKAPAFVKSEAEEPTIPLRAVGAGLGVKDVAMADDESVPVRAALGATPVPQTAGPALSRTSGSGGFDPAALMRQMGWTGGGLGKDGKGIVNPVEVKMRPNRAGVAFGGKEKPKSPEPQAEANEPAPKVWKRRDKKRTQVVYRTYDEIVAGANETVLDATGAHVTKVESVAAALANHSVPSAHESIPELRHNVALLVQGSKDALDKLARHGAALRERQAWLTNAVNEARDRRRDEEREHAELASVMQAVRALHDAGERSTSFRELVPAMSKVVTLPHAVIERFGLDEAVAGALVPAMKHTVSRWDPLQEPLICQELAMWTPVLLRDPPGERPMTPYESVLWNVWMPAVRRACTQWDVHDAAPLIALIEGWQGMLPAWLVDNIYDQLVLPKLEHAIHAWTPQAPPMHVWILPWLAGGEARMSSIVQATRRKWRSVLSSWRVADGVPPHLPAWRSIYTTKEWDALLLERIVPVLSRALRTWRIDPRHQDMRTLEHVLAWYGVLRDSVLSRVLEADVGSQWLDILHAWLTQPDVDAGEVAAWYEAWRQWFPPHVARLPGPSHMFMRGLHMMNAALDRGAERVHMPKPSKAPLSRKDTPQPARLVGAPPSLDDISFRAIVEEHATHHDLFVRALNQLEPSTGLALLRISSHIDGKMGTTFYIDDDVIFIAAERDAGKPVFEPVSLAELVARAHT